MAAVVSGVVPVTSPLTAQPAARPVQPAARPVQPGTADKLALDPIKCWWRSSATSVVIGEHFTVTLTCGLVDTSALKTMTNRDNLEPTALSLTPFDVVGGVRHEDILIAPWRYFQYEYTVRLVGGEFFDKDVVIPALGITYNIVSTAGESQEREHTYRLPPLRMRVASLVPKEASGIRDLPLDTFGAIEARRFRVTSEFVGAAVASGFALLLFGLAAVRTFGRYRVQRPLAMMTVRPRAALRGALRATREVKQDVAQEGWNAELAARAIGPLRVAAAVGMGRPLAQSAVTSDAVLREGQIQLRSGILRRRSVVISGAASAQAVSRHLAARETLPDARDASDLEAIGDSLRVFSAARYGRSQQFDGAALETALTRGEDAINRLCARSWWPVRRRAPRTTPAFT